MESLKLIISSRKKLEAKYGNQLSTVDQLLKKLVAADKKKKLDTRIVYIDDAPSMKQLGMKPISILNDKNAKTTVDALYAKYQPDYIVILGAQDVFPFQSLKNEIDDDDDTHVPSDLPYACEAKYSNKISKFTNPVRVVGRIPDVPGKADIAYLKTIIENSIKHKPLRKSDYLDYFSVTAKVWQKSTAQSIQNIFGNNKKMLQSPTAKGGSYTKSQLSPLSHFFNCHGALNEVMYYGQKGDSYPVSFIASDVKGSIRYGTLAVAECCYGAQLLDPTESGLSVASNYLLHHALSFMGSSTIAYGPASGQGLADLICQYFMINVHRGASTGRALLEARQKFLNVSAPHLDPYELKTLAQFYMLGDPSLQLVISEETTDVGNTIKNRRLNLFSKGIGIGNMVKPAEKLASTPKSSNQSELRKIKTEAGFEQAKKEAVYKTTSASGHSSSSKAFDGGEVHFRTFSKKVMAKIPHTEVLIVKESEGTVLGWKVYLTK